MHLPISFCMWTPVKDCEGFIKECERVTAKAFQTYRDTVSMDGFREDMVSLSTLKFSVSIKGDIAEFTLEDDIEFSEEQREEFNKFYHDYLAQSGPSSN